MVSKRDLQLGNEISQRLPAKTIVLSLQRETLKSFLGALTIELCSDTKDLWARYFVMASRCLVHPAWPLNHFPNLSIVSLTRWLRVCVDGDKSWVGERTVEQRISFSWSINAQKLYCQAMIFVWSMANFTVTHGQMHPECLWIVSEETGAASHSLVH